MTVSDHCADSLRSIRVRDKASSQGPNTTIPISQPRPLNSTLLTRITFDINSVTGIESDEAPLERSSSNISFSNKVTHTYSEHQLLGCSNSPPNIYDLFIDLTIGNTRHWSRTEHNHSNEHRFIGDIRTDIASGRKQQWTNQQQYTYQQQYTTNNNTTTTTTPTGNGTATTSNNSTQTTHSNTTTPVKLTPIPDATGAAGSVPVPGATGGKPNGRYGPDDQYIASGVVKTIVPILSTFVLMSLTVILTTYGTIV
ncbi:hypothetical protein H4Q26_010737 [Puccinia striiformis f. sp. tritici PST-130]|nr:hypothetical protein H4Q26_010737 [Puccinia striiformis f. sp. tritici PST-130]